jgi:hypothetical protein
MVLSGVASEAMQNALISMIRDWMNAHPRIFWLVSHPFLSLVMLLFAIFVLWGFFKALGSFFEKAWLAIFSAPIKFSKFIFGLTYRRLSGLRGLVSNNFATDKQLKSEVLYLKHFNSESPEIDSKIRRAEILSRLEAINQEQKKLLQELAAILDSDKIGLN